MGDRGPQKDEERDRQMAYFYTEEGLTLQAIGNIYNCTRERVRQILKRQGTLKRPPKPPKPPKPPFDRDASALRRLAEGSIQSGECRLWQRTRLEGYGRLNHGSTAEYAHRLMWKLTIGPIDPPNILVNKKDICGHKNCINPDHWYLDTLSRRLSTIDRSNWRKHGEKKNSK